MVLFPRKYLRLRTFSSKIAKARNTHKCTDILRLWGAEIAKNLEKLILSTLFALNGWVWGRFSRSRVFRVSKVAKNISKTCSFFTFCATTEPSVFATPPDTFGRFCIFRNRDFKIGQKALEGWQKSRVPENRKSWKWGGEFGVPAAPAAPASGCLSRRMTGGEGGGFPLPLLSPQTPLSSF